MHLSKPDNDEIFIKKVLDYMFIGPLPGFISSAIQGQKGHLGGSLPESQMMVLSAINTR